MIANSANQAASSLLAMLRERDRATCCHSEATAEWTRRLSRALALDDRATDFSVLCGLLHDVGKIATPDAVLSKGGALDDVEWEIMREHAAAGGRILDHVVPLQSCSIVVRAHHERYDGTGYPDALAGASIPLEARIVAVADAFHAMISDRPYRRAIAPRRALELLEEGRGTQWDPDVVDAMLGLFSRRTAVATRVTSSSA